MPVTVPRSVGQLPMYYNEKPSAHRGYHFDSKEPLFPFGFGLSYTSFEIGSPQLASQHASSSEAVKVSVTVKNTGSRKGDEVVQLYVRDLVSSVTRPVKELKGFSKVRLAAGETKTVELPITFDSLAFHDISMNYVVEPGEFAVMVGTSSRDADLQSVMLRVEK